MLVTMAFALLVFTFFLWSGVPVFMIGSFVSELTSNLAIIHFSISISGGILISIYFVPINLKVAKHIASVKKRNVWIYFMGIEIIWVLVCSLIFAVIFSIVIQL